MEFHVEWISMEFHTAFRFGVKGYRNDGCVAYAAHLGVARPSVGVFVSLALLWAEELVREGTGFIFRIGRPGGGRNATPLRCTSQHNFIISHDL